MGMNAADLSSRNTLFSARIIEFLAWLALSLSWHVRGLASRWHWKKVVSRAFLVVVFF